MDVSSYEMNSNQAAVRILKDLGESVKDHVLLSLKNV